MQSQWLLFILETIKNSKVLDKNIQPIVQTNFGVSIDKE